MVGSPPQPKSVNRVCYLFPGGSAVRKLVLTIFIAMSAAACASTDGSSGGVDDEPRERTRPADCPVGSRFC